MTGSFVVKEAASSRNEVMANRTARKTSEATRKQETQYLILDQGNSEIPNE